MRKSRSLVELIFLLCLIAAGAALLMPQNVPEQNVLVPRNPEDVAMSEAIKAYKKGDFVLCSSRCDRVFSYNPHNLLAVRYKGMALAGLGQLKEATSVFDKGIRAGSGPLDWMMYPNRLSRLYLERARVDVRLRKYDEALKDLERSDELATYGNGWEVRADLKELEGLALAGAGRYEEAEAALQAAFEYDSEDPLLKKHRVILEGIRDGHEVSVDVSATHPGPCPLCDSRPVR